MRKWAQIGFVSLLSALAGLAVWLPHHHSEPVYQGRTVSYWYETLCSGVFGGTPAATGFQQAYDAFAHVGPEMVPYLTEKLRYDRAGVREMIIHVAKKVPCLRKLTKKIIIPTERRSYAAVALRQMGPKARTAIPALLEAWASDNTRVKINAVSALEAILGHKPSDGLRPADWQRLEKNIISQAAHECPKEAGRLGISEITTATVHP